MNQFYLFNRLKLKIIWRCQVGEVHTSRQWQVLADLIWWDYCWFMSRHCLLLRHLSLVSRLWFIELCTLAVLTTALQQQVQSVISGGGKCSKSLKFYFQSQPHPQCITLYKLWWEGGVTNIFLVNVNYIVLMYFLYCRLSSKIFAENLRNASKVKFCNEAFWHLM